MARRPRHWTYSGERIRKMVLIRDNYECQIRGPHCDGSANTVDHIHPKAWGGSEQPHNLRAACKPCNQIKGARADAAQPGGFFREDTVRRARLPNPSPRMHPKPFVVADYSRKASET